MLLRFPANGSLILKKKCLLKNRQISCFTDLMLQYFCWAARNCKRAGASRKHRYKVEQRLPSIWPSRAISDRDWQTVRIGQLHDDDIWLQLPAQFISVLLCYLNLSIPLRIKESKWNSVSICKWNSVSTSKWNSVSAPENKCSLPG